MRVRLASLFIPLVCSGVAHAQYLKGGMMDNAIHQQPLNAAQQVGLDTYAAALVGQSRCGYKINRQIANTFLAQKGVDLRVQLHKFALDNSTIKYEQIYNAQKSAFCTAAVKDLGPNGEAVKNMFLMGSESKQPLPGQMRPVPQPANVQPKSAQALPEAMLAVIDASAAAMTAVDICKYKMNAAMMNKIWKPWKFDQTNPSHKAAMEDAAKRSVGISHTNPNYCRDIFADMGIGGQGPAAGLLTR